MFYLDAQKKVDGSEEKQVCASCFLGGVAVILMGVAPGAAGRTCDHQPAE